MILATPVRLFLGFMLLYGAWSKLRKPTIFWSVLQRYPVAGWFRSAGAAKVVPVVEMILAGALLLPFPLTCALGCYGTLAFILVASAAIHRRYRRGETWFACGCSSNLEEEMPASSLLLRNGVLILAVAYAIVAPWHAGTLADYGMGLALLLAFELFQRALVQEGRVRMWKASG
jgi:hypothetical protein